MNTIAPIPGSPLHGLKRIHESPMSGICVKRIEGRSLLLGYSELIDFATGAYLGLDSDLCEEDVERAKAWGLRNGWSRATGTTALTRDLEENLADALGMDGVRLSTSAALINYSAFHSLKMAFPMALYDEDSHITLKQGLMAAYGVGERHGFRNNDLQALEQALQRLPEGPKLIVLDGVYSMKGTEAPVGEMVKLCVRYNATLFIDDVHGFGVRGPNGLGVIEQIPLALRSHVMLLGSFAKSASNPVAFLAYPAHLWVAVESIAALNYSGPPSNLHVAVCLRHLASFKAYGVRRARLVAISERLHRFCAQMGFRTLSDSGSPILTVALRDEYMERATEALHEAGILCKVAVYPVVRKGDEVLRFTLTAIHTDAQIDTLEEALLQIRCFLQTCDQVNDLAA